MKRLNTLFLEVDLKKFLKKQIADNHEGSFREIQTWLIEYNESIKNTHKEIIDRFSKMFPTAVIKISPSFDGEETFFLKIYGVDVIKENLHNICREIEENELNSDYMLIPSVTTLENTKRYYYTIYEEYVEKNSLESS